MNRSFWLKAGFWAIFVLFLAWLFFLGVENAGGFLVLVLIFGAALLGKEIKEYFDETSKKRKNTSEKNEFMPPIPDAARERQTFQLTDSQNVTSVPPSKPQINEKTKETEKDFIIGRDGVLRKYKGNDFEVVIPDGVTTIGDGAFYGCDALTNITISKSVRAIGKDAFSSLKRIKVDPENQVYASDDCGVLFNKRKTVLIYFPPWNPTTEYTIPDGVTTIGDKAFCGCIALANITIPNSVTTIGDGAFSWCKALTSITIPDGVTTIGDKAFYGCDALTNITISKSVRAIGKDAFLSLKRIKVDPENQVYASDDCGVLFNKRKTVLIYFPRCNPTAEYTIPDGVTTIGDGAFSWCEALTSITIPGSVTTIGNEAFSWCKALTSITISDGVTTIGDKAFCGCRALADITIPNSVTTIGDKAFCECRALADITIPNSVTTIGDGAFLRCSALTNITIPDGVTTIGREVFSDCWKMRSASVPNRVTGIGERAFSDCWNLTDVSIPNSVTSIGKETFVNCHNLTGITIPDSVTSIGDKAFFNCIHLTDVAIPDSVTSIGTDAFNKITGLPDDSIEYTAIELHHGFRENLNYITVFLTKQSGSMRWCESWPGGNGHYDGAGGGTGIPNDILKQNDLTAFKCRIIDELPKIMLDDVDEKQLDNEMIYRWFNYYSQHPDDDIDNTDKKQIAQHSE